MAITFRVCHQWNRIISSPVVWKRSMIELYGHDVASFVRLCNASSAQQIYLRRLTVTTHEAMTKLVSQSQTSLKWLAMFTSNSETTPLPLIDLSSFSKLEYLMLKGNWHVPAGRSVWPPALVRLHLGFSCRTPPAIVDMVPCFANLVSLFLSGPITEVHASIPPSSLTCIRRFMFDGVSDTIHSTFQQLTQCWLPALHTTLEVLSVDYRGGAIRGQLVLPSHRWPRLQSLWLSKCRHPDLDAWQQLVVNHPSLQIMGFAASLTVPIRAFQWNEGTLPRNIVIFASPLTPVVESLITGDDIDLPPPVPHLTTAISNGNDNTDTDSSTPSPAASQQQQQLRSHVHLIDALSVSVPDKSPFIVMVKPLTIPTNQTMHCPRRRESTMLRVRLTVHEASFIYFAASRGSLVQVIDKPPSRGTTYLSS
jgi:hypothetical protein